MKINRYQWEELSEGERSALLRRAEGDIAGLLETVRPIIEDVRSRGDAALIEYARKFDGAEMAPSGLKATPEEFALARQRLDPNVKQAVEDSVENIRRFHRAQMPDEMWLMEVKPGIMAGEKITPIASAGLYVPRGKGAFPSVMMMLCIPAVTAQVPRLIVCTPPTPQGTIDDASLFVAEACGVTQVYKAGGSQAVAAMAYGTQTVPKVDKVIGPGNPYVSAAKRLLYGVVDVGTPAGPSEAIILCDESADPEIAAVDLLIEAEHGPDSAALLVTHSARLAQAVLDLLPPLVQELPRQRREFCSQVLSGYGGVVLTKDLEQSIAFINEFAPEHLEVLAQNPMEVLPRIQHAGEILLGPHTPISLGNFSLGVNAILPTGGFARTFSCVTVYDFLKRSSIGYATRQGCQSLAEPTRILAEYEGFPAHVRAIERRRS